MKDKLKHTDDPFYIFALRMATAMEDIKSSHVYFIAQKAMGEDLSWDEVEIRLKQIMACDCKQCKKIKNEVRRNLK